MLSQLNHIINKFRNSIADAVQNRFQYEQRAQFLLQQTLTNTASGVTAQKVSDVDIVVSLTTHGRRLYDVYLAVESIMQGSVLPNRIILWIPESLKQENLPRTLQNQCKRGLEIFYIDDIGPYTKSIPAFISLSHSAIVTIDDDILYPFDTLEMLLACHQRCPSAICANRILDVAFGHKGQLLPMSEWRELTDKSRFSTRNYFEGVGAVLYPPHCFPQEDLDPDLFRKYCPSADDIWFNVLAIHHHLQVAPANLHYLSFPLLINESVQDSALWRLNGDSGGGKNDIQLSSAFQYFGINPMQLK